ncbi:MAG: DUF1266 domain-containing protein [Tannerellaceae bacterium]|nr:DUF1266 domain-containing protein [Tannerellaceae bacterium]
MLQEFFSTYYLVIFVGVVIIILFVLNLIHRRQQIAYEEATDGYYHYKFRLNKKSQLTPEQYKRISVGAVYSQQQTAFLNSLETGLEEDKVMNIVNNWWGLTNAEEAIAKLEYLDKKGFAYYFPSAYKAFLTEDEEQKRQILLDGLATNKPLSEEEQEMLEEDLEKAYNQQENLADTYEELLEDKVIRNKEDIPRYGVTGWDCGRLNFLARLCYDAGYISEQQAWVYIDKAYFLAKKTFTGWEDFGKSYVIGRAMWGGEGSENSGIADIASHLCSDPESPWVQMPL